MSSVRTGRSRKKPGEVAEPQSFIPPECIPDVTDIVIDDGEPVDGMITEKQMRLLTEPLYSAWTGLEDGRPFLASSNVGIFAQARNPALVPETSNQWTAGIIWEPAPGVSIGLDYWNIHKRNVIGTLDDSLIFEHFDVYGQSNVIRGPVDPAFPNLPGPIHTLIEFNQNVGNQQTSGIDVSLRARSPVANWGRVQKGAPETKAIARRGLVSGTIHVQARGDDPGFAELMIEDDETAEEAKVAIGKFEIVGHIELIA